jgi:stringent starvation protein B
MTSTRPYLLRALHEWMVDNALTPQIVVDARAPDVQVPRQFVEDGRIVLNVAPSAVRHLTLGNERIEFMARFSGTPFQVAVPARCVLAIVARETGAGMTFAEEPSPPDDPAPDPTPGQQPGPAATTPRPRLKVVK